VNKEFALFITPEISTSLQSTDIFLCMHSRNFQFLRGIFFPHFDTESLYRDRTTPDMPTWLAPAVGRPSGRGAGGAM
jgi:hypothetical protein